MSYAMSLDDIPAEIFLALCGGDEALAFEMMVKVNNGRDHARTMRQNQPGATKTRSIFG